MNKFRSFIDTFSKKTVIVFFFVITSFLFILSIFNTCALINTYQETTFFFKDNALRNTVLTIVAVAALVFLSKIPFIEKNTKKINSDERLFEIIKILLLAVLFAFCLCWIFTAKFYPEADQYAVQEVVAQLRENNITALLPGGYIYQYPHQSGLLLLSYLFSFVAGKQDYLALEVVNAVSIVVIFCCLSDFGRKMKLNNFCQLLIIASGFLFPVLILYSYFIYGTIPGFALCLISLKHFIEYHEERKLKNLIICFVALCFALWFRTNYIIFAISLILVSMLWIFQSNQIKSLILSLVLLISVLIGLKSPVLIVQSTYDIELNNGMSNWAWIAMGMSEGDRAPGWYNGYNADSYAASEYNTKIQTEIVKKEITNRLDTFGNDSDYATGFFIKKIASEWNNPSFQVFWNLDGKISSDSTRDSWVMYFVNKEGSYQFQKYLNLIQTLILFGVFAYVMFDNRLEIELLIPAIFFIGGFLFQVFWEAKAQYNFVYFYALIPYFIAGYTKIVGMIKERKLERIGLSKLLKIIFTVVLIALFIIGSFSYLNVDNKAYYNYIYDIIEY